MNANNKMYRTPAEEMAAARVALDDAQFNLEGGRWRVAAKEAYNAALRASHARLLAAGLALPRSHSGVNAEMARLYKMSSFRPAAILSELEGWKAAGDYGHGALPKPQEAAGAVDQARSFLLQIEKDIGRQKDSPPTLGFITKAQAAWKRRDGKGGIGD